MTKSLLARLLFALVLLLSATAGVRAESDCEAVTNCHSNADCFGGVCTPRGICLCPA